VYHHSHIPVWLLTSALSIRERATRFITLTFLAV